MESPDELLQNPQVAGLQADLFGGATPKYRPSRERQALLFDPREARQAAEPTPLETAIEQREHC